MDDNFTVYHDKIDGTSIRLLQLSLSRHGHIKGKLKAFPLASAPPFYSASYTWGSKTYSQTTIRLKTGQLPVLESLAPFLLMICEHEDFHDDDWWWIDSLSINLDDAHEREQQVRIMADIYKRARKAIVWLGREVEDGSDCSDAVDFMYHLVTLQPKLNEGSRLARLKLRSPEYAADWEAVGDLLARPWWTRVWTLQEFVLPREVVIYVGEKSISRGKFKSAMYITFLCSTSGRDLEHELIPRQAFDAAFNRRRIHQWFVNPRLQGNGMSLVAIMAYLSNHLASDPRDRIFSCLGLITERDRMVVGAPEYTTSAELQYARLVRSFWNEYKSLDIICFSHLFNRYSGPEDTGAETATPSWAPDWRVYNEYASPVPLMASQSASEHIGNFRPLHGQSWKVVVRI